MAKFPPDDFDLPGGSGAPLGGVPGGYDPGETNFQKGNKGRLIAIGAIVAALGVGGYFLTGSQPDEIEMTVPQAAAEMKNIFVLPKGEQITAWKKWASSPGDSGGITELKQEALKQLAWAEDPEGVPLAAAALTSPSEKLQGMAATVLAYYGSPRADGAKPNLLAAFKTAGLGAKPQIAWALIELREAGAFGDVLTLYRAGHLANVQRLGGGNAFDANKLVAMITIEKLAELHTDESPAVRQLVATVLSRNAEPRWTAPLLKLLEDPDQEVARQAAPGLGKIGDKAARDPLIAKLKTADQDSREKYLEAIKNGSGGVGLVTALYAFLNEENVETKWFRKKQIFGLIDSINDPRAADSLYDYMQVEEHIHYQYRAARAMAELGDVRAVPVLAKRLRMDPLKIYSDQYDWEMLLKRDDKERIEAARMIADLAVLNPDKRPQIKDQAEEAVILWSHEMPSPHANGLRALALMGSDKDLKALREWSNPDVPLPKEGQQPPMPQEWVVAQSALRYIGMLKDDHSFKVLLDMLEKKPANLSIANESMYQGGLAILGMSLNAIGKGAADGLSEWGDPKAFDPLMKFVVDVKQNENAREAACAALAWVSDAESLQKVAEKISEFSGTDPQDGFRRRCLVEALVQKPVPGTAPALLALLTPEQALETRVQVARAIAKAGIDAESEAKLLELAKNEALMNHAILALVLGGSPESAARAVALFADKPKVALEELQDLWFKSFGFWSVADLDAGVLFRFVDNATAISHVEINATPQMWAPQLLERQFDNLIFDNGPHSFTRVVLRNRLLQMASGSDAEKAAGAIRTLKFMKELGVLMAVRDSSAPSAKLAADAAFEIVNPRLTTAGTVAAPASAQ
jgi:HEAT repeat protein